MWHNARAKYKPDAIRWTSSTRSEGWHGCDRRKHDHHESITVHVSTSTSHRENRALWPVSICKAGLARKLAQACDQIAEFADAKRQKAVWSKTTTSRDELVS